MKKTHWLAVVILLSPLLAFAAESPESPEARMETIIKNAVQREKLFERVDAKVSFKYVTSRGTPDADASGRWVKDGAKVLGDYVYKDATGKGSHKIYACDGNTIKGMDFGTRSGEVAPAAASRIYDLGGEVFLAPGSLGIRHGVWLSRIFQGNADPANLSMPGNPVQYKASVASDEKVDGRNCAVIDVACESMGISQGKSRFYLAQDFGYAPVKIEFYGSGDAQKPRGTWTASGFKQGPEGVWYPTESKQDGMGDTMGSKGSAVVKIEEIKFPETIDPALFTLQFPAGTRVYDGISGNDYVVKGKK